MAGNDPSSSGSVVALAHDYLTQRGGAERVALELMRAFPGSVLHTTVYHADGTFPEFQGRPIATSPLNSLRPFRRDPRLALPVLAPIVDRVVVDADVLLASSSGWAHGMSARGRKVVYCHAPARWLYQPQRYLGVDRARVDIRAAGLRVLRRSLLAWDARAAASAQRYVANSTVTRDAIRAVYGRDAEVVPPPPALVPGGPVTPVEGLEARFVLCVARLLPYKNVDVVIEAARSMPGTQVVVVGDGPDRPRLAAMAADAENVTLLGRVDDAQLRWLYSHAGALVAASFEDYGLSPLEAAAFGCPTVALRAGGYLDTVVEDGTGLFFDLLDPQELAGVLLRALAERWDGDALRRHAEAFGAEGFRGRLRSIVAEELAQG